METNFYSETFIDFFAKYLQTNLSLVSSYLFEEQIAVG